MPVDQTRPFQASLHGGDFSTLDFQPARDVVGCGGVADLKTLREAFAAKLKAEGVKPSDAEARAAKVRGAVIMLTEQFLVMGMDRGIVLDDVGKNKTARQQAAKSGTCIGFVPGSLERQRTKPTAAERRAPTERSIPSDYPSDYRAPAPASPRLSEVAAMADRIGDEVKKIKRGK